MPEDPIEGTPTADHVEEWLKSRAKAGVKPSDIGQTEEELPQGVIATRTRELREKFENLVPMIPEFVHASHIAYQAPQEPEEISLPPVVFTKKGYLYYYQKTLVEGYVFDITICRKKVTKNMEPIPNTFVTKGDHYWEEKLFIQDFDEGEDSGVGYQGHDDFQWQKGLNGEKAKAPLKNTNYVFTQAERIYQDLS